MHGGGGSVYTNISKSRFADIEVQLPNVATQKAIAHILSTLDDKITLNRKLNATLEAMAQALFQSWFVDFDPVKAKLAAVRCGRDPEQAAMAAIACKLVVPPGKPKGENLEEKLQEPEANAFPIPSNKFTPPGIKDQLRTLYTTLEQFYLISHRIKNP